MTRKILGVTIDANETNRQWAGYEIDYDDERDFLELAQENGDLMEDEDLTNFTDSTVRDENGSVLVQYEGTDADGNRIGSNLSTVTGVFDDLGIEYTTTDVYPSDKERHVIKRENARTEREATNALEKRGEMLDRLLVEDGTRKTVAEAILQIESSDKELGNALDEIYEVITGEKSQETLDRLLA
jgi:hypothetical protein